MNSDKVATEYPHGAIKTIEELKSLIGQQIWNVAVGRLVKVFTLQRIETTQYSKDELFLWSDKKSWEVSVGDRNIPELNGYNNNFLFSNEQDAQAFIEGSN